MARYYIWNLERIKAINHHSDSGVASWRRFSQSLPLVLLLASLSEKLGTLPSLDGSYRYVRIHS